MVVGSPGNMYSCVNNVVEAAERILNLYMIQVQPPRPHSAVRVDKQLLGVFGYFLHASWEHFNMRWAEVSPRIDRSWLDPCAFGKSHHRGLLIPQPREIAWWNQHTFFFTPQITRVRHKHVITTALVPPNSGGSEGSAAILDIWGCRLRVWESTECVRSHVNKCQLDSEWNSLDRMQQPLQICRPC